MVNLKELLNCSTDMLKFDNDIEPFRIDDGTVDSITAKGCVRNFSERLELEISIDGVFHTKCSRCADDADYAFHIEKQDRILRDNGEDEYIHIDGESFDLTDYVHEEINLNLPIRVLCTDSCKGLCPTCGAKLSDDNCSCRSEVIDSRLAKLKELLDKKEE